ncbi:hypothetical protein BOSEA31B_20068 [Hyphomicrobiales bacterium]|nr:hypothetical protein BOSEA31B_20068 [Hyphomicrobiales bacterium]CAI0346762.1 hypothetical protein BO1005MUT1_520274 [Hyphomicrobiales bacterium]
MRGLNQLLAKQQRASPSAASSNLAPTAAEFEGLVLRMMNVGTGEPAADCKSAPLIGMGFESFHHPPDFLRAC